MFYDEHARTDEFIRQYAQEFSFVEVDTSFYAAPKPQTLRSWDALTPPEFRFSFKTPRDITHDRALANCGDLMARFIDALTPVRAKLGPVLVQLPPTLSVEAAPSLFATLARVPPDVLCAVEFRHHSWLTDEVLDRLEAAGAAAAAVDGPFMPLAFARRVLERTPRSAVFLRLLAVRGSVERFDVRVFDRSADLRDWSTRLAIAQAAPAYVTVSNYYEGFAVESARRLLAEAAMPHTPRVARRQTSFFDSVGTLPS